MFARNQQSVEIAANNSSRSVVTALQKCLGNRRVSLATDLRAVFWENKLPSRGALAMDRVAADDFWRAQTRLSEDCRFGLDRMGYAGGCHVASRRIWSAVSASTANIRCAMILR